MLADERTTHRNELPLPSEAEGLIVAPDRTIARPLVAFLRAQGLTVRTADDADTGFEEALLHPPDVVLVDDRVASPPGAVDLCARLKDNVRTHFVPVIVCALNDLRSFQVRALAAGADAVFVPSTDAQERKARLWALLRTRALQKRAERSHRTQQSAIVERRHWLSHFLHDLTGQVAGVGSERRLPRQVRATGGGRPAVRASTRASRTPRGSSSGSRDDAHGDRLRSLRDRPARSAGDAALSRQRRRPRWWKSCGVTPPARRQGLAFTLTRPENERALYGDRELLAAAMLNLGMGALRRVPSRGTLSIEVGVTDSGVRFRAVAPGPALAVAERMRIFEPYGRRGNGSATYGLGLALAHAVIGLHDGRIWAEDVDDGKGCAFVFELGWQRSGPRPKRGSAGGRPGASPLGPTRGPTREPTT